MFNMTLIFGRWNINHSTVSNALQKICLEGSGKPLQKLSTIKDLTATFVKLFKLLYFM